VNPLSQFFRSDRAADGVSSAVALQPECHHEQSSIEYRHLVLSRRVFPTGARRILLLRASRLRATEFLCARRLCDRDSSWLDLQTLLLFHHDLARHPFQTEKSPGSSRVRLSWRNQFPG
jgi:hypothetical protein